MDGTWRVSNVNVCLKQPSNLLAIVAASLSDYQTAIYVVNQLKLMNYLIFYIDFVQNSPRFIPTFRDVDFTDFETKSCLGICRKSV